MVKGKAETQSELFSIGHSNHTFEHLLDLLQVHRIEMIADVRSRPYSRHNPQFSRDALQTELGKHGIPYFFLGKTLGGKPENPACMGSDGKPDYARMAALESVRAGLDRLQELMGQGRVAILCAEEDPSRCHRRHLIARILFDQGIDIRHIRGNGKAESEAEIRHREAAGTDDQLLLFSERA